MNSQNGISYDNAAVAACPKHLLQFAVDQRYDDYTSVDHAVWRFIMRQNIFFLKEYAHKVYFQGLLDTGISFERIPRIEEMNDILAKIEWGAVAVDGFIPPAAFMEFQAYKVLVIACDMRQIHHIEYTPAPDIVHEAAGHAPIIVDREYSNYLQRFGEVGAKAMSSKKDFELYQAIRHLSILKERPNADPQEVEEATKLVEHRQKTLGKPSEMALLSRLHWWTVEYGLIGTLENPKIYGAGLLSSIGESVSCLEPEVKKIPYSIDAQNTRSISLQNNRSSSSAATFNTLGTSWKNLPARWRSWLADSKASRKRSNVITPRPVSIRPVSKSAGFSLRSSRTKIIPRFICGQPARPRSRSRARTEGHGIDYHKDGFGSPIGKWKQTSTTPELFTNDQLHALGIVEGKKAKLEFVSGLVVSGKVEKISRRDGKLLLITFSNCNAKYGDRVLFDPDWGVYDMAVGERISSVFNGAADKDAYNQVALVPKERTIKVPSDAKRERLENLYAQVRKIRESKTGYERLGEIWETQQAEHPEDWLLSMEIFEILDTTDQQPELKARIEKFLNEKKATTKDLSTLIGWGFRLVEYHKKPEYQTALHVSPK